MESLPKPLVLRYDTDKYYLVNGEFILSLQKALNITPDVLQATINTKIKRVIFSIQSTPGRHFFPIYI